jgi:hypothetical protein
MITSGSVTVGGQRQVFGPFELPAQTAALRLVLFRKTDGNPVDWPDTTKITSWITCELDGKQISAEFSASGGIQLRRDHSQSNQSSLSWTLPWGFFNTANVAPERRHLLRAQRIGETATSRKIWLEFEGTGPATVNYELTETVNPAPDTLRYHHSIAFENSTSAFEAGGDQDISVSFTANSGTNRAACVAAGSDREHRETSHTVTYGGAAQHSQAWASGVGPTYTTSTGSTFLDSTIGSGAKTVRAVGVGGTNAIGGIGITVVLMSGVHQTTPTGTGVALGSNGGSAPSVTVTGFTSTDLLIDGYYAWDGGTPTPGAGQTQRALSVSGDNQTIASSSQPGSVAGGVMSYNTPGGEWAIGAVAYKEAAGGLTNPVMAAGLGTITLAGQVAVLRNARKVVAGLGTLTASGQPVALRVGRKVVADLGTLTLSGQPATLTYSRKLSMAAGLGVLTPAGQAINLTYSGAGSKTMLAGLGTLTLSGQPVTVRYARKMPAGLGTLTLSGQPATLTYSRKLRMAADLGTITLSGQPAVLRYAHKMAAGLGTLTLAGQPVTLTYSRKLSMTAGLGTLTLAGQNATLTKASSSARVMAAGLGTITIDGQPVTVRYAHRMPAGLGTVTLGGQPVGLRRAKNLTALVGNINLTGQAAGLTYTHGANIRMAAGAGTLVLSGQSVRLDRTTTLAGLPGVLHFGRRVTINRW